MHPLHIGTKKTLTPRQALAISVGGLGIGMILLAVACGVFLVPFSEAMAGYAIMGFFCVAFPWASLKLETRNRAVRAHNYFVYFFIAMLIVTVIAQWGTKEGTPFPKWAIGLVIIAGVAAYSVMAYYAVVNFRKWLKGGFKNLDQLGM
ncbi:MAG TPA: hypothetical protein VG754_12025 [Verrucomicrobiae bacterium]|jgi:hypothetical protein|nr:hypothetical protein [Verrucomicrobiae bacterium]